MSRERANAAHTGRAPGNAGRLRANAWRAPGAPRRFRALAGALVLALSVIAAPGAHPQTISVDDFLAASASSVNATGTFLSFERALDDLLSQYLFSLFVRGESWQSGREANTQVSTVVGPQVVQVSSTNLAFAWIVDRDADAHAGVVGVASLNSLDNDAYSWSYGEMIAALTFRLRDFTIYGGYVHNSEPLVTAGPDGESILDIKTGTDGAYLASADNTVETERSFVDISFRGIRFSTLFDFTILSFVTTGIEAVLSDYVPFFDELALGSTWYSLRDAAAYYVNAARARLFRDFLPGDGPLAGLGATVSVDGLFRSVQRGALVLSVRNDPYDLVGFNYRLSVSVGLERGSGLFAGGMAEITFPRLFYGTQVTAGVAYNHADVLNRVPIRAYPLLELGIHTVL